MLLWTYMYRALRAHTNAPMLAPSIDDTLVPQGGYRNAAMTSMRLLEDMLGGSLTGEDEGGSEGGVVEYEFNGVKPK